MWAYLVRTLVTIAGEDIGMADPTAMNLCMTAYNYWVNVKAYRDKMKSYYAPHWKELGLLIVYLVRAKKNRYVDLVTTLTDAKRKKGWKLDVPTEALDQHCDRGRQRLQRDNIDADREFYGNGAKTKNHIWIEGEQQIKKELMELLGYPELSDEDEELK